jgi:DNA-binding CsgD family transcriptional regulator
MSRSVIGRAELLDTARARLAAGGGVLLHGPAGIGKSTLVDALAAEASGALVLRAAAAEAEADLPYLALVDLFGGVLDEHPAALPPHLRVALDGALLRSALPATPHDQLAVRLAVLDLLRGLAARQPVLVVIDDIQWLDEPSQGVLRFAARRLEAVPVRMLAAERVADGDVPQRLDLCPRPTIEIAVPPLPEADVADLLHARFGAAVPRARLHRLYTASGGNPLFAVELGRALQESGEATSPDEPLPVPERLRRLLAERIANLPGDGRRALLVASATGRPTQSLLARCGVTSAGPPGSEPHDGLCAAVRAGVVVLEPDGAIRFTHPLLREMVYADADIASRRAAHQALAAVVTDPVERARHLAHAQPEPDERLAETLADAAAVARLRGAPATAADLAVLAAERTPPDAPGVAAVRRLAAAEYAFAAGTLADAQRHATAALRDAADRRTRVGARLVLVDLAGQDLSGVAPLLDAAFCDALDAPDLLAKVRLYRSHKAKYDGDTESTLAELKRAEQAAEQCGDTERLVEALWNLGVVVDGPETTDLLERASELARGLPLSRPVVRARQLAAMARLFVGDVPEAVRRIEALRTAVERSGTVRDLAGVLLSVAGVYTRAGRCADALLAGRSCARLFSDMGTTPGPGLVVGAFSEAHAGDLDRAAGYAERAVAECLAAGDNEWLHLAYAASGLVHLLRGDQTAAADQMRRGFAIEQRRGRIDPAIVPWHADFIEALIAAGARSEAAEVLVEVRSRAERLQREVVMLGLARAEAMLTAATGEARDGVDALTAALQRWSAHPYPLEVARAWHVLGGLERRAHRRGAARMALSEALRRYTEMGAVPWRDAASADLARLDGGRGAGLSETERRIVELVRAGATNREIARSLFLSIKAVEANLTRLYRRLGVRNRAQLARALDSADAPS